MRRQNTGAAATELSTNEQTRKEKTQAVETLHAEIDDLEASIAKLTEDHSQDCLLHQGASL